MTNEAPSRRYAKGDAKRREILEAALTVISERGYRNSSLQEIAEAVGLTKAGVLHYFDSREDLLTHVLRERDVAYGDLFTPADGDVVELLRKAVVYNQTVPGLVQLYSRLAVESESHEHAGHDFFKERYQTLEGTLSESIRARQRAGQMRTDVDPVAMSHVLTAVSDGLQMQWMHDPTIDMAAAFDAVVAVLAPPAP
ncbi:TetR/AcrR family transcriptional regulator [Frondihabitans cladoniiphilus]|uniref:TetR/AcrR family transcriptional regulator n=1 Tax=Frondihabitans cladoniiphilus TaxID=715785 RepID=A0ABP8W847_9MICO